MKKFFKKKYNRVLLGTVIIVAVLISSLVAWSARAEQTGSSPSNSSTSTLTQLYATLQSLGNGTDTASPDWGTYWNRVKTAALWVPAANATPAQVRLGQTFYSNSRTQETGISPAAGPCSTETSSSPTQTTNCGLTWTTNPSGSITGDDNLSGRGGYDPRTGLTWSQALWDNAGTLTFSATKNSTWSWDGSGSTNQAMGGLTAIQLCSAMGNSWRLPTQIELMQAFIDGAAWNLTQVGVYWSSTMDGASDGWPTDLQSGDTHGLPIGPTFVHQVRCVR